MSALLDSLLLRLPYRRSPRLAALFVLSAIACWGEPGAHGAASPALSPASADFPDEEPVLAPAQPPVPAPPEAQTPAPALVPVARPTPAPSDLPTQLAPELGALSSWVKTRKGDLSFALRDLGSGRELMGEGAGHALNPASNQKLVTAAVALSVLGPSYRFHVGVLGKINGGVAARLVLRGNGDPSFGYDDLRELTSRLVALGLKRVTGDILVDHSAFDDQYTPPAFEQQPSEWSPFRAPVSGVSLNRNAVTLHVFPTQPGQPARVEFEPPGYVSVQGEVRTEKGKKRDHVGLTMRPQGTALSARVSGDVPAGETVVHLSKRIENPEIFAAAVLKRELISAGVAVQGQAVRGGEDETDELVGRDSATLAELTNQLGKASDNFYAETLFKALGARAKGAPGSAEKASAAIGEWLAARGLSEDGLQIRNGSGLYDANRISARTLTRLLEVAYLDPAISAAYQEQLAVGGLDGTLRTRFYALRNRRSVHAKTGTLNKVVALSGYVFGPEQQTGVSFSIIVSGIAGEHGEARKRIDALVLTVSDRLWKRELAALASR